MTPKEKLEVKKLQLEVDQLQVPFWKRPSYVGGVFVPVALAALTLIGAFVTGYFDAERSRLKTEKTELAAAVEKLRVESEDLKREKTELQARLERLNEDKTKLENEITGLEQDAAKLRDERDQLKKEVEPLKKRVKKLVDESQHVLADLTKVADAKQGEIAFILERIGRGRLPEVESLLLNVQGQISRIQGSVHNLSDILKENGS